MVPGAGRPVLHTATRKTRVPGAERLVLHTGGKQKHAAGGKKASFAHGKQEKSAAETDYITSYPAATYKNSPAQKYLNSNIKCN